MLPPWNDMVWSCLLRGVAFGFVGGLALILLFLLTYKHSGLVALHPGGLLYFLVGVEIGVALVGALAFAGLEAIAASRQRFIDQQNLPPRN